MFLLRSPKSLYFIKSNYEQYLQMRVRVRVYPSTHNNSEQNGNWVALTVGHWWNQFWFKERVAPGATLLTNWINTQRWMQTIIFLLFKWTSVKRTIWILHSNMWYFLLYMITNHIIKAILTISVATWFLLSTRKFSVLHWQRWW